MTRDADASEAGATAAELALELAGFPGAGPVAGLVGGLVAREHARRRSVALRTAEQLSGLSREELADVLQSGQGIVNATVSFLYAVGEAGDDEVLEMIGATLARALRESQREPSTPLAEERLVLRALRGLTSEHVRLMIAMGAFVRSNQEIPISIGQLRELRLVPDRLLLSLLAYLELNGMTETPHGRFGGGTYWELSELGRLVLRAGDETASR